MKEYQRQMAIEQIAKDIEERRSLVVKKNELEELKKDPKVAQYLELVKEIEKITQKYKVYKTEKEIIEYGFRRIINTDFRCHHEIWLYGGSYYLSIDTFRHEHDYWCKKLDENEPTVEGEFEFRHNKYICLECGKRIETKDWESFEKNHFVLKDQNTNVDVKDYISQYYQYLYTMTSEEAQEKIIQAFNIEKAKCKAKILR